MKGKPTYENITLKNLLSNKIKERGLTRSQLAQHLGYTNVSKGLRRLDAYLQCFDAPSDEFVVNLLSVLNINGLEFHKALTFSQKKILYDVNKRAQERFRPEIRLLVKIDIRPLLVRQIYYNQYCVESLPLDIQQLPFQEEVDLMLSIYRRMYKTLVSNMNGQIAKKLVDKGFRYFRHYDSILDFNADGVLTEVVSAPQVSAVKQPLGNRMVNLLTGGRII